MVYAQTTITVHPDSLQSAVPITAKPGVFYVPKTSVAASDFNTNGIYQNAIRTHVIESALNNAENLDECLAIIESVSDDLLLLSGKCQKFIFIFEKMPAWLSSSADSSPASTPGWFVLNTKPPADWAEWEEAIVAITNLLVNDIGINNAWFEVWNEPDLGSWTASEADYFELYKRSYDAIKSVDATVPVGGPAVNFWANHIYWQPPVGRISNAVADSSLMGQLLEYGNLNACLPDFLSWHNFNLFDEEFNEASRYIEAKCALLSIDQPFLILSEWNAPSVVRETPLHKAFIAKGQHQLIHSGIDNQVIAAWQDFEEGETEFHADYGMLTWGGVYKPAYYASLMANELKGSLCKIEQDFPAVITVTAHEDSLYMLLVNYCPPPFVAALNHTFYSGGYNAQQLDSAGFIDLELGDLSYLEDIYAGDIVIGDESPMHEAINSSVEVYTFYALYAESARTFNISLEGYMDEYHGVIYHLNDTVNNNQFKFDSLLTTGYSRTAAADYLRGYQSLSHSSYAFSGGEESLTLDPNALVLIKLGIDGVGGWNQVNELHSIAVYPNPTTNSIRILGTQEGERLTLYDLDGRIVGMFYGQETATEISLTNFQKGIYLLSAAEHPLELKKIIKN